MVLTQGEARIGRAASSMEMNGSPDLSIIIVNWNTCDLLRGCLASIYRETRVCTFEIFVVDNASGDHSNSMVREEFPEVHLIRNQRNEGFPKANNRALRQCRGKYILFLNPDTVILEGAIDQMVTALEKMPHVGAMGPQIVNLNNEVQYDGGRNFPTVFNVFLEFSRLAKHFPHHRIFGRYRMGAWDHQSDQNVNALDGCCMLIRHDILDDIGSMDEQLFMYLEDMDLCYRIRRKGWAVYYLSRAKIVHVGGQSSRKVERKSLHYTLELEAYRLFNRKHYGYLSACLIQLIVFSVSLLVISLSVSGCFIRPLQRRFPRFFSVVYRRKFFHFLRWSLSPEKIVRQYEIS